MPWTSTGSQPKNGLGQHNETVAVISVSALWPKGISKPESRRIANPIELFYSQSETKIDKRTMMKQGKRKESEGGGGWNDTMTGTRVVADWLPERGCGDFQCCFDTIDVDDFDVKVFWQHYVKLQRPLLIKGGGAMPPNVATYFTKAHFL